MPRSIRFLLLLLAGLGLLSLVTTLSVQSTMRRWFAKDLNLRSQLAYSGARLSLIEHWHQPAVLRQILDELCSDERLTGAAACDAAESLVAHTDRYPASLGCGAIAAGAAEVERGLHVSSFPVPLGSRTVGTIRLLHDLSFVERRTAIARRFLLICFAVLAALASLFTVLLARITWREWSDALRQGLQGRPLSKDFLALRDPA